LKTKLVSPTQKTLDLAQGLFAVLKDHNQALFRGFDPIRRELALCILADMAANLNDALLREDS